ncbi:MAG: hypothetical protein JSU87_12715 [Gemmatimonadota bacterium]|nr:MAG: hypothetical protein JSU87_12715 [Gemmatimonadota bacterium]
MRDGWRYRVWLDRAFTLMTAVMGLGALYLLTTERVIPALRGEPGRVGEGERLVERLELEPLERVRGGAEGVVEVPGRQATVLMVFSSSCPACYTNVPAWRRVLEAGVGAAEMLAVGLQRDRLAAREYVRAHLRGVRGVVPTDPRRFAAILGIEVVPFTAVVGGDGVLRYARQGSLDSAAVHSLLRALGP